MAFQTMRLRPAIATHRFDPPEGFRLCRKCGSTEGSDLHLELEEGFEGLASAPIDGTEVELLLEDRTRVVAHFAEFPFRGWVRARKTASGKTVGHVEVLSRPIGWKPLETKEVNS